MLLFSVILQEYSEHAPAQLMHCQTGVYKLDGTCSSECVDGTCSLQQVQQICGRNSKVIRVTGSGFQYLKCVCDFDAGAVLAFDGLSCIALSECFTLGGTPGFSHGGMAQKGDGKEVCTCGDFPYDPVNRNCSKIADSTLVCPVQMVMTFTGKCVAAGFDCEAASGCTSASYFNGRSYCGQKGQEDGSNSKVVLTKYGVADKEAVMPKRFNTYKCACAVDTSATPKVFSVAPNKVGCIVCDTTKGLLLDTKTGICACDTAKSLPIYTTLGTDPTCVAAAGCLTGTLLVNGVPTCQAIKCAVDGCGCGAGYRLTLAGACALATTSLPANAAATPDTLGLGGQIEVCNEGYHIASASGTTCTANPGAAGSPVLVELVNKNWVQRVIGLAANTYSDKFKCIDGPATPSPTSKIYVQPDLTCDVLSGTFVSTKIASTEATYVGCASGSFMKYDTTGPSYSCVSGATASYHNELNYRNTGINFQFSDETANCDKAGFAKDPATSNCVSPANCGENALVDTTVASNLDPVKNKAVFTCTCKAGVTIRYLSADSTATNRICVDSCFAAKESAAMGYEIYYPFSVVSGFYGMEYKCASGRRPDPGYFCEYYPTARVKRFDGNCAACTDNCQVADNAAADCDAGNVIYEAKQGTTGNTVGAPTHTITFAYPDMGFPEGNQNFRQCACNAIAPLINFAGKNCITTAQCTAIKNGKSDETVGIGMLDYQKACVCQNKMPVDNQGTCAAAACTTQDCVCPVGTALLFNGTCTNFKVSTISSLVDTDICGASAVASTQLGIGFFRCQCPSKAPFVAYVDNGAGAKTNWGCTEQCTSGLPANINTFGHIVCGDSATQTTCSAVDISGKKCLCNFDQGYYLTENTCKKCSNSVGNDGTPMVDIGFGSCKKQCAADEVANNTASFLCVKKEACYAQTGEDGQPRILSLDKNSCIDRKYCTEEHGGVVLGNSCVCGDAGQFSYLDTETKKTCTSQIVFPMKTTSFVKKCPGNYYLSFRGLCAVCPATGCFKPTGESINAYAYCGENTEFFYNSTGNYYGCRCATKEGAKYVVNPARDGCIASCHSTMTAGHVYEERDACDCAAATPAFTIGQTACDVSCGDVAVDAFNIFYQMSNVEKLFQAHTCKQTCSADSCTCEKGYVLNFGRRCVECPGKVCSATNAEQLCGGNSTIIASDVINVCACSNVNTHVVSNDNSRCILKEECAHPRALTVLNAEQTRCISSSACQTAISVLGKSCVYQTLNAAPSCGDNAIAVDGQCICQEGFALSNANDAGCVKSCNVEDSVSTKSCFNASTPCEGDGCYCSQGRVLTLQGLCKPKRERDNNDCGANSNAQLIKQADGSYLCQCPAGNFLSADRTKCEATCGAGKPYVITYNGVKQCIKDTLVCSDKMRCLCDHSEGYAVQTDGLCVSCNDGIVSSQYACQSEAVCMSNEVFFGRLCLSKASCLASGYVLDVTGKRCLQGCNSTQNSETLGENSQCTCAKKYTLSKDGFYCKRNFLNGGEIAGIIIGVVAAVAIIGGVVALIYMKKAGKACGSKKASKKPADKTKDDITTNADPALAVAK